jgi:hypothetical protein
LTSIVDPDRVFPTMLRKLAISFNSKSRMGR